MCTCLYSICHTCLQELLRKEDNKWCNDIDKDLDRTFPEHEQFCVDELCEKKGNGCVVIT